MNTENEFPEFIDACSELVATFRLMFEESNIDLVLVFAPMRNIKWPRYKLLSKTLTLDIEQDDKGIWKISFRRRKPAYSPETWSFANVREMQWGFYEILRRFTEEFVL